MSSIGVYNLCLNKGATFGPQVFRFRDSSNQSLIDLTGLSARSKIRDSFTGTVLADLVCNIPTPINGEIWVSSPSTTAIADNISPINLLQIADWSTRSTPLTKEELKLFNPGISPYVWDLETYDSADPPNVLRRLTGLMAVTSEVTYDDN